MSNYPCLSRFKVPLAGWQAGLLGVSNNLLIDLLCDRRPVGEGAEHHAAKDVVEFRAPRPVSLEVVDLKLAVWGDASWRVSLARERNEREKERQIQVTGDKG